MTTEEFIRDYAAGRLKDTDGTISWKEATEEASDFLKDFRAKVLAEAREELKKELLERAKPHDQRGFSAIGDTFADSARLVVEILDKHGSDDYPVPA